MREVVRWCAQPASAGCALECGDLSPLSLAGLGGNPRRVLRHIQAKGGDKSPGSKAVTSHRTPKPTFGRQFKAGHSAVPLTIQTWRVAQALALLMPSSITGREGQDGSTFKPGQSDPLDKRTLGEEKEDDARDGDNRGHGHERAPGAGMLALELLQGEGQRVLAVVLQVDERVEEIAPLIKKHEQGRGGQSWLG